MNGRMLLLLSASMAVQVTAAVLALRSIPLARHRGAWLLISSGFWLMGLRRFLSLLLAVRGEQSIEDDWITESVALATSLFMLAGIARISPIFQAIHASDRVLRESEERQRTEEQLRASERKYRTLVENIGGAVYIADGTGRFTFVTPQAEELTGYTEEQLLGMTFRELLAPESLPTANARFAHVTAGGTLEPAELIIRRADGRRIPIETYTSFLPREPGDSTIAIQGLARDITRRKQIEKQLGQAQRLEIMDKLASGMAHDFNNMLAVVIGQAQLLSDGLAEDDPAQQNIDLMLQASNHAKDLLRRILALGRNETGERTTVFLPQIVDEVLLLLRPDLQPGIRIETEASTPSESLTVFADPTQMQQVLMNLCTNALHAMQSEGGTLRVGIEVEAVDSGSAGSLSALPPGTYVKLTVSDTGSGIDTSDPEMLERIFDPLFSTKPADRGTGLGLAVVLAIVTNHGGAVTVDSTPGVGTRFQVYLPQKA